MNKLQKEAKALSVRLGPLYGEVAKAVNAGATPAEALAIADYYNVVEQEVLSSCNVSATVGTSGTTFIINGDKWNDWYANTNHHGGALSSNIRNSQALTATTKVLKDAQKLNTSVNALADTIQRAKGTATNTRLPKALKELTDTARANTAMTPEMRRQIKEAERYVKTLSGGPSRGSTQLKNSYTRLISSVKGGKFEEKYIEVALNRNLRYVNERIARTEIANSYELSRRRAYEEDPAITHFKWELSPEHPRADECDYLAEADLYGKGEGVYPIDSGVTCPAHLMCLCTTFPLLYEDEKGRYSAKRGQEYLNGLPADKRKQIIGAKTPVSDGVNKLKQKGVDPKAKTRAMMPKDLLIKE